jgi:NADH:ubiquinone oxidoreductase subunit 6 (subunit J)
MDVFALIAADRVLSPGAKLADFLRDYWPIVVPVVLGLVAVYLLLPRVRRYPPLWGALIGGVALVFAGWSLIRANPSLGETILFYAFSAVAVVAGVLLICQTNPGRAALSFALVVLSTCGLFLLQAAPFLMAGTVIIYAGAIIVTFLFVLMLAQQAGLSDADQRSREPLLATVAGFVLLGTLLCVLHKNYDAESIAMLDPLEPYFARTKKAAQANSAEAAEKALGDSDQFFKDFEDVVEGVGKSSSTAKKVLDETRLVDALRDAQQQMIDRHVPFEEKRSQLRHVADLEVRIRSNFQARQYAYGSLQPSGHLPLSDFSGLPPNLPKIPRDGRGQPSMPARNVAALGQSLFTDYLLAVELAGTLLLVATIGAIAIAGRRPEGLR